MKEIFEAHWDSILTTFIGIIAFILIYKNKEQKRRK